MTRLSKPGLGRLGCCSDWRNEAKRAEVPSVNVENQETWREAGVLRSTGWEGRELEL